MSKILNKWLLIKTILAQMVKASPSLNLFMAKYMQGFHMVNVGGYLVLHSHLPPINSQAYAKFVREHLLNKTQGPTHAQIGITNVCPQHCDYCYNQSRAGKIMDKDTIIKTIKDLKDMGVVWLGLTGGEPLLNRDILEIVDTIGDDCASKLFTGGYNLTRGLAHDLKKAGLRYVSVSLDDWREEEHDRIRACRGSFKTALKAIEIFQAIGGIHIGVSTVLSKSMLNTGHVDEFIQYLIKTGVNEAWLSEVKPAHNSLWDANTVITEEERQGLLKLQDRYNQQGRITVNYLGHFEGGEHFGCNAGHKMVYIDPFGEVSPCVFAPLTFGNVNHESIKTIFDKMREHFRPQNHCFVNHNYQLFEKYYTGRLPLGKDATLQLMNEVRLGPLPEFFRLYYK